MAELNPLCLGVEDVAARLLSLTAADGDASEIASLLSLIRGVCFWLKPVADKRYMGELIDLYHGPDGYEFCFSLYGSGVQTYQREKIYSLRQVE